MPYIKVSRQKNPVLQALFIFLLALAPLPAGAASGDILVLGAEESPLLVQPATESRKVATLKKGAEMMERRRQAGWVYVIALEEGEAGWVPLSAIDWKEEEASGDALKTFLLEFTPLNNNLETYLGEKPFARAEDVGKGLLRITANDKWLAEGRHHPNLNIIFEIWGRVNGARAVAVSVVDSAGVEKFFMLEGPEGPVFTRRAQP